MLVVVAGSAAAQQAPQATRDSGRVVLETRLGGDSGQATTVFLRRGATYRLAVRPSQAEIVIRPMAQGGANPAPLDLVPAADDGSGDRVFTVAARDHSRHLVELTNTQVGATGVRLIFLRRADDDTLRVTGNSRPIFDEFVGDERVSVPLDSGRVYRFVAPATIWLTAAGRDSIRMAPPLRGRGGVSFIPGATTRYRILVEAGTDVPVQVYEIEARAEQVACIRDPEGPGCGLPDPRERRVGMLLAILSFPIMSLVLLGK